LVNEIRNEFLNKEYKQKLTLSRYGIGTAWYYMRA
jgi:hypothetical protein